MTTFALVHGSWHGAWCWERLAPELEARGHRAIAMDLPCDDAAATFETYADVVVDALDAVDAGEDVVVVGHSLGGLTIPLVAARRPVSTLVYLCALVPMPGHSFAEQQGIEPDAVLPELQAGISDPDDQGRTHWVDADVARRVFYADCDDETAQAAFERLRPQSRTPHATPCALDVLPSTRASTWSAVRTAPPTERGRAIARGRLDAELVELPGSHSPFLSRPADLASVLHDAAVNQP